MIVGQIRGLLRAGLPTSVIRDLPPCAQGKAPRLTPCPDLIAVLREAAADMQTRIDSLTANRDAVLRYLDAAETPR
ncbi:hypothetical protein AB0E27_11660 [Streptomyces sparsogenes]|uniref:hypothetical protein n=1 Tax=Streptomyces sparsogenes TaxID=67365 RepID=UPI0033E2A5B8